MEGGRRGDGGGMEGQMRDRWGEGGAGERGRFPRLQPLLLLPRLPGRTPLPQSEGAPREPGPQLRGTWTTLPPSSELQDTTVRRPPRLAGQTSGYRAGWARPGLRTKRLNLRKCKAELSKIHRPAAPLPKALFQLQSGGRGAGRDGERLHNTWKRRKVNFICRWSFADRMTSVASGTVK